jgi:alpha-aminoadipic semialdehyde synthase
MRKSLVVGILKEDDSKHELRVAISPQDVRWLIERGIEVEVQTSRKRIFKDEQYRKTKATIVKKFKNASLLVGVKEPKLGSLLRNKIYMVFSHTIKGQPYNMPLLREFIRKRITLIDYERIIDTFGRRLVYFGRFAGICGLVDSLYYLGKKLEWQGIRNPFLSIKPAYKYNSLDRLKEDFNRLYNRIKIEGFNKRISPFVIGITGHGRVSLGVQEILTLLKPKEIHPKDMDRFIRRKKYIRNKIYKIVFHREEKFRSKNGSGFYFEEYLRNPKKFESNLDIYLPYLNILLHTSYWDSRYPRLVTKEMVNRLYNGKFRLEFIGDISCDIAGSIEMTYKSTTIVNPVYTYCPKIQKYYEGYKHKGITILARDNLPVELPEDASEHFSKLLRDYIYQIAAHGVRDIVDHIAIPREIRNAVITQDGKLTENYKYLKAYI